MPSRAAGRAKASVVPPKPVPILNSDLLGNALSRLSTQQYQELEKFRKEFPTIKIELSPRTPNCFILFRSWYVAEKKKLNDTKVSGGNGNLDGNGDPGGDGDSEGIEGSESNEDLDDERDSDYDEESSDDGVSSGDSDVNDDRDLGDDKDLSDDRDSQGNKKSDGNSQNQTTYSREAGVIWKRDYPRGSSKRARFEYWSRRVRFLWKIIYPNGFPASLNPKKQPIKSSSKPKVKFNRPPSKSSASLAPSRPFQPLPSPPISDDVEFEKNPTRDHGNGNMSESEDGRGDSEDEDYLPGKSLRKRRPSRRQQSSRKHPRLEPLTPMSMTRELSAAIPSRSPSPTPVFSNPDSASSLSPIILDVNLSELNGEGPSTFTTSSIFSALSSCEGSHLQNPGDFFEQIAVGYSLEEQITNTIVDWNQTDLMSDLDPVRLYLS